MKELETERLLIRHFGPVDLAEIHSAVYPDPEVCRDYTDGTRTVDQSRSGSSIEATSLVTANGD